jgi:hypothetical protein
MSSNKKLEFTFEIGTIDHLGVKLYSTIPPMIAELISNAWDADAHNVYLYFNDGTSKSIVVKDDGSGMDFDELNEKFLKIGRNRRIATRSDQTPGNRFVLGKKGLGKLSMFGIGKKITISTIKNGKKNSFQMDYDAIKACSQHKTYEPVLLDYEIDTEEVSGTEIKIENLARQSGFDLQGIRKSILSRFSIFSNDFIVHINDNEDLKINTSGIATEDYQFKWEFPKDFRDEQKSFSSLYKFGIENNVTGTIYTSATPLSKKQQGIILFSRGKLVQESMSFSERANDNFFQYMAGSFSVDFIDQSPDIDNCSTDRKSLAWDTYGNTDLDILKQLLEKIVSMTQNKWRQLRKDAKKQKIRERGVDLDKWIEDLNPAEKTLARKLVDAILENENISEEAVSNYISYIKDMYGFTGFQDFTAKLDELGVLGNENAIKLLTDWSEIEAKEYAKISLGRIKTIEQFDKYIKENASENKVIQKFLEEFPWLLDPKMEKFEREVTYTNLLKRNFPDEKEVESNRRIDFLCTRSSGVVHVIELKRPNIKLTTKQIQQIAEYVEFIKRQCPQSAEKVKGYLISDNMTYEPGAETIRAGLESQDIYVKSYSDLLAEARLYNKELYDLYTDIQSKKELTKE